MSCEQRLGVRSQVIETYLVVLYDLVVVPELATNDVVQIQLHLLQLSGQSLEAIDLLDD